MPPPDPPAPPPKSSPAALTPEQRLQLLHDELNELKALNARLEFLRLMLKLRNARP